MGKSKSNVCGKDHRHNGWTNYETWAVALWIDNDQGSQEWWAEIASEIWESSKPDRPLTRAQVAANMLAERLRDEHEEGAQAKLGEPATVFADLLSSALSEVNWYEIAQTMIGEARKGS